MNVDDGNKDNSNGKEDDKEGQIIDEVQWNQSCIAIMERSAEFVNAMEVADKALFSHDTTKATAAAVTKMAIMMDNLHQSLSNDTSKHHHVNHIIHLFMVMMLP